MIEIQKKNITAWHLKWTKIKNTIFLDQIIDEFKIHICYLHNINRWLKKTGEYTLVIFKICEKNYVAYSLIVEKLIVGTKKFEYIWLKRLKRN